MMPLNWEEFYSTASGGVQGEGSSADVSRWEGGWTAAGSYQPNAGESNTFRATDITTTLPGSMQWDTISNGIVRTRTPDEQVPWGIEYMYSNSNLAQTSGGRGVDVAVIDTGVDTLHPDLTMRIEDYFDLNSVGYEYQKGTPDGYGHGTHVSGTIAADGGFDGQGIWGMAPEADLKEYRVFDEDGSGNSEDFVYAPFRAVDLGADIISMSYGGWGYDFPPEVEAMSYAAANGVLLVASAGNGLPADTPTIGSPASYPDMVSVGAINKNGQAVWWTSPGYNDGDGSREANEVMFAAPGYQVLSTIPTYFEEIDSQDENGGWKMASDYPWYASWPGTSMACPHISGTAAKTLSEGLYNGAGISESNADYVKGVLQSYAGGHAITQATLLDPWVLGAAYYRTLINVAASRFAGTPPGDYYKAMYDAILRGDTTVTIPGNANDNCLTGLGVPRLPAGST
jgi:subtilisin family serine protease